MYIGVIQQKSNLINNRVNKTNQCVLVQGKAKIGKIQSHQSCSLKTIRLADSTCNRFDSDRLTEQASTYVDIS